MIQRMQACGEAKRAPKVESSPKAKGDKDKVSPGKEKKVDNKPRKCLIIRKTRIDDNVEKVVMKYVDYRKIQKSGNTTALEVISDASNYLNQRAKHSDSNSDPSTYSSSGTHTVTSHTDTVRRKLRLCLPIIYNIRARYDESEQDKKNSPYKREQSASMKALCEDVIKEATLVLENDLPIPDHLMEKIKSINQISRQIISNETEAEKDEEEEKVLFHM